MKNSYLTVSLCRDGITHPHISIHRLVAFAFVPNPSGFPEINHLDSCRTNNLWSNLEWTTRAANLAHAHAKGRMIRGGRCTNAKLTEHKVHSIRAAVAAGATARDLAELYSVKTDSIYNIVNGKTWKWL
jgi:hypothetical protein